MGGLVIWITGLPGSGKSTIAEGVRSSFPDFTILRMDDLRKVVTPEPAYSEAERDIVYRALVYTAKMLSELGHKVIIDATGNLRKWRELARQLIPHFAEVYLRCPLPVCTEREAARTETRGAPSGIYRKGMAGWPVPGVQAPYEEPPAPELIIETDKTSPEASVARIGEFIAGLS